MSEISIGSSGELIITPASGSSPRDFDFYQGNWKIQNKKLRTRLNGCTDWDEFAANGSMHLILGGMGNTDTFQASFNGVPFEGMTLRLFNPVTRLWSIYWADNNAVTLDPPVVGSFDGNTGTFYTRDVYNGIPVIMKFVWDKSDSDNPVWSQAFSPDNGKSWEWNWYMYMQRIQ